MGSLRILHCLRSPVGGLFRHVRDLAGEQGRRGYNVGILCDDGAADSLTEARLQELDQAVSLGVHRVPMARGLGLNDIAAFLATRKIMQSLQIDVAHGHGAKGGAHARLAARALRSMGRQVATFYTPHGGSLHYEAGTLASRLFMTLERQLIPATDGIVFESAFAQNRYLELVGTVAVRQQVIFNGLQPEEFMTPQHQADATDLLYVGELRDLKGVDVLIKAIAQVHHARPITATIVGEGPDRGKFESLTQELDLSDAVRFVGAKPARDAFQMGKAIVVPSRKESFPYVVLEAAAACLPLIATNVGGIPEIVAGSDTALINSDDVAALSLAISDITQRPVEAAARSIRLRDLVGRRFTVAKMTDDVVALYRESNAALAA
jgi:glycosyltransferase involved in cell wall biosynthesis